MEKKDNKGPKWLDLTKGTVEKSSTPPNRYLSWLNMSQEAQKEKPDEPTTKDDIEEETDD